MRPVNQKLPRDALRRAYIWHVKWKMDLDFCEFFKMDLDFCEFFKMDLDFCEFFKMALDYREYF